jgi:large subunit ribosomal protein L24
MLKIKKGDKVRVITGSDKGKEGTVEVVFPKKGTAYVPGVGLYKKHVKAQVARDGKGGVYELFRPIAVSKLAVIDPKSGKPTRIKFQISGDKKLRVSAKSNELIDSVTK